MILRLYGEDFDDDPEVFLRLLKSDGKIRVVAYDSSGHILSDLVEFLPEGTLHRNGNVNPDIGFKTDNQGRVKTSN